jgi:hypothetical protein
LGYVPNAAEAKLASTTPFACAEHARLVLRQQLCHVKVVYLKNPTRSLKYWNSSRCGLETSAYDGARMEVSSLLQLAFPWTSSRLSVTPFACSRCAFFSSASRLRFATSTAFCARCASLTAALSAFPRASFSRTACRVASRYTFSSAASRAFPAFDIAI